MRSGRRRIILAVNQYTKPILNKLGSAQSKNVRSWIVLARKDVKCGQFYICKRSYFLPKVEEKQQTEGEENRIRMLI